MSQNKNLDDNSRPCYDRELQAIADYALNEHVVSSNAWHTARLCLLDALGCAILALQFPACTKLLTPTVVGVSSSEGARIPGTALQLDPVRSAWNIGCMIRWLDYNDTWLGAEWGHPSDNLGAVLAVADMLSLQNLRQGKPPLTMRQVFEAMIIAYEVQGCLALENSFNGVGLDHVILVKVASVAAVGKLMKLSREQMLAALSHAFVDGQALRTYRHAPNTVSRKSWAAGDATARAVQLVDIAMRGEAGIPSALSASGWGFYDVSFRGNIFKMQREYSSYVIENILFKVSFPAEFHAQTAVEAAFILHEKVKDNLDQVATIEITTQASAIRIISKKGALNNPADRDHCLQYMVAVGLLFGALDAEHYEDNFHHNNSEIDALREKMEIKEDARFSEDYHATDKRSIANAIQIFYKDGSKSDKVTVEYPLGHRRRRSEAIPCIRNKFAKNILHHYDVSKQKRLNALFEDDHFLERDFHWFMSHWIKEGH